MTLGLTPGPQASYVSHNKMTTGDTDNIPHATICSLEWRYNPELLLLLPSFAPVSSSLLGKSMFLLCEREQLDFTDRLQHFQKGGLPHWEVFREGDPRVQPHCGDQADPPQSLTVEVRLTLHGSEH